MKSSDPRIDGQIAKAADFAKPVLRHLRELIHEACPDATTLEWLAEGKSRNWKYENC